VAAPSSRDDATAGDGASHARHDRRAESEPSCSPRAATPGRGGRRCTPGPVAAASARFHRCWWRTRLQLFGPRHARREAGPCSPRPARCTRGRRPSLDPSLTTVRRRGGVCAAFSLSGRRAWTCSFRRDGATAHPPTGVRRREVDEMGRTEAAAAAWPVPSGHHVALCGSPVNLPGCSAGRPTEPSDRDP
jgi:hypothetical protein